MTPESIDPKIYWFIGVLIFSNLGVIGSVFWAIFKGVWWLSKLDQRVDVNTKDINGLGKKVKDLESVRMV